MLNYQRNQNAGGYLQGMDIPMAFSSTSPTYPTASTALALAPFATSRNMEVRPYQGVPRTQDTFAFSHANEINTIVNMTLDSIETTDGWEFVYAPPTPASTLHEEIVVIVADDFMLERTAENTAPRHIDLREESYAVSMEHFQLGFGMNREQLISDRGREELRIKTQSFIAATVRTMKMAVKGAVIASPNYWPVQAQAQQRFNSIGEADAQSIAMFGALTRTHKGLNMIYAMVRGMLSTGSRRPNINMAVGPYALAYQAQYRHAGPTESWRAGPEAAQRALSQTPQDYIEGLLPGIRYYTDKEQAPVNANLDDHRYPVDPFRRVKHLGAYSVLQYDDTGPVDPACGKPVPTVRCVTADANGYTEYTMRGCLENCARFGEDGSITAFTQRLIEQGNDVSQTWGTKLQAADYDPWIYQPTPMPGGERAMTGRLRPCKHFGDQNTMHRPEEFDIAQGKKFKCMLNLSDEEDAQIRRLFEVAQYLYEVPANKDAAKLCEETYKRLAKDKDTGEPYLDTDWGAPFLGDDSGTGVPRTDDSGDEEGFESEEELEDEEGLEGEGEGPFPVLSTGDLEAVAMVTKIGSSGLEAFEDSIGGDRKLMGVHKMLTRELTRVAALPNNAETRAYKEKLDAAFALIEDARKDRFEGFDELEVMPGDTDARKRVLSNVSDTVASGKARPYVATDVKFFIPYGFGDIFAVLSLLKNVSPTDRRALNAAVPMLRAIDYPRLASTIYKIWDRVRDVYPHLAAKNADAAPYFRRTDNPEQDEMISVFRGLFERVKFPFWKLKSDGTRSVGMDGDDEDLAATGFKKPKGFDQQLAKLLARFLSRSTTAAVFMTDELEINDPGTQTQVQMYLRDQLVRNPEILPSKAELKAVADAAEAFNTLRAKAIAGKNQSGAPVVINTMLTVDRRAFLNTGVMMGSTDGGAPTFYATNGETGVTPIHGTANVSVRARAQYGTPADRERRETQRASAQKYGPVDRDGLSQFSRDPAQFIDARRANEIGGLFLDFDMVDSIDTQHPWIVESPFMSRRTAYVGKVLKGDPIARLGAFCFLASKVTRDACLALLDHGMNVPMNFILAWPFIQIDTLAMMFAEGGIQTARCNYMLTDVTRPEDGVHKMLDWNLTTWLGANNTNPVNQIIVPDVACAGYRNGLGSSYITELEIHESSGNRLSDSKFDGCIPMDVAVTFDRKTALLEHHNPLPLFGKHDPLVYAGIFPRNKKIFNPDKPHFSSWPAYNAHFGFDKINEGARYDSSSYLALRMNTYIPGTMYLRRTQTWNGVAFDLNRGCRGTGHLDHIDPDTQNFRGFLDGLVEFTDPYASY
jgi:hypothetical protein